MLILKLTSSLHPFLITAVTDVTGMQLDVCWSFKGPKCQVYKIRLSKQHHLPNYTCLFQVF